MRIPPILGLAACLLAASCGDTPAPGPAAPGTPSAPPAHAAANPLEGFRWDPDELLPLPGELVAQPGSGDTWLEGVVEDPEGNPVAGARVIVGALPYGASAEVPCDHAAVTTGADGRFKVGPGPAPWPMIGVLHAEAPGYARTTLVNRTLAGPGEPWAEPGEEIRVRLRPGITVTGDVRGEDGGAPDGPVRLWAVGRSLFSKVVDADASGAFTFVAPEGPLTLTAVDGPHPSSRAVLEVRPGAENVVHVKVRRGRDIPVRILDAETGEPVKGAVIRTYYGVSTMEKVPDDGRFLLPKYWFTAFQARAPGYAAKFNYVPADAGTPENPVMQVRLPRGFVATGRVLDLDGRPMEGIRVRCFAKDAGGDWVDIIGGTSRADGSWTFVGLPLPGAGKEIRVFAIAPGCGYACSEPLAGTAGALIRDVDIRIPRLVEVHGRVADENGAPLPVGMEAQWELPRGLKSYLGKIGDRVLVRVLGDGTFSVLLPERNRYVLRVHADAIEDALQEGTTPAFEGANGEFDAHPLVVKVRRGATIRGTVVDATGSPVERGEVRAEPSPLTDDRPSKDAAVGPGGVFEIGGLAPGKYDLSVLVHPEYLQEVALGVETGGPAVPIVLRRAGGIIGTVLAPEDAPTGLLAEVTAHALGPSRPLPPERSVVIPAGVPFRLGPLSPGAYAVKILAGDRRMDIEKVVVEDGGACDIGEVALVERTGVVEGTVTVAGAALPGVPVEILRLLPDGRYESVVRVTTGAGGAYRAARLENGPHRVVVHPRNRPLAEKAFEAKVGGEARVDVEVPAGGVLAVRVLDGADKPVAGARVVLQGPGGSLLFWKEGEAGPGPHGTGEDGSLRCTGVAAGPVRVVADLPGAGSGEAEAAVADGGEVSVVVRIQPR